MDKPTVKLTGTSGNVFSIIAKVKSALEKVKDYEGANNFMSDVDNADSYDAVLQLAMKYCDVS